jgi:preprotein translocase subunit SecA
LMRYLERSILLQVIDNRWREHLFDMDYLREGIHLRGFAQIDPLVAYKNEGFSMFSELMHSIWEEFSKLVFRAEIQVEPAQQGAAIAANGADTADLDYSGGTLEAQPSALQQVAAAGAGGAVEVAAAQAAGPTNGGGEVVETVVKDEHDKVGRNDPCWCGSGKKYKKCHGA